MKVKDAIKRLKMFDPNSTFMIDIKAQSQQYGAHRFEPSEVFFNNSYGGTCIVALLASNQHIVTRKRQ